MGFCTVCQSAGSVNKYGFCEICGTEHQAMEPVNLPELIEMSKSHGVYEISASR